MCRAEPLTPDSLVHPAIDLGESANPPTTSTPSSNSSSKVDALLSILHASHTKDPTTKTVIFSQWTSFLDIIGTALTARSLPFTRIDGSMRSPARDAAMTAFSTPSTIPSTTPSPHILLASLAVCSVGLNLVAANQVILADSW
jgi:SWI/SNF-related matrix-associated actin-dependent regulator of chromatin subfamily A3